MLFDDVQIRDEKKRYKGSKDGNRKVMREELLREMVQGLA